MADLVFKYLDPESKQEKEFSASFTEQEVFAFQLYNKKAVRLRGCKLIQNEENVHFSIKWDKVIGLKINSRLPNDNDFAALLHFMRPFILKKKEITNFNKIVDTLYQKLKNEEIRESIAYARELFSGKDFLKQIKMSLNDEIINNEKTLTKWLNAFEYHPDQNKIKELETMDQIFPLSDSKAIFISMIFDKVDAVFRIKNIVGHILYQLENDT